MNTIKKSLMLSGVGAIGVIGIVMIVKYLVHHHGPDMAENAGKDIDEKLHDSMTAFNNATSKVQQIFEHLKNLKL